MRQGVGLYTIYGGSVDIIMMGGNTAGGGRSARDSDYTYGKVNDKNTWPWT